MSDANIGSWNRAMRGAFLKGVEAGLRGDPESACPYADKRKHDGKLTWSRAFARAWEDGWKHAHDNRTQALITLQYARPRGRR